MVSEIGMLFFNHTKYI